MGKDKKSGKGRNPYLLVSEPGEGGLFLSVYLSPVPDIENDDL